jgi:hypothetical protein
MPEPKEGSPGGTTPAQPSIEAVERLMEAKVAAVTSRADELVTKFETRLAESEAKHKAEIERLQSAAQEAEKKVACTRLLEAKLQTANLPSKSVGLVRDALTGRVFEEKDVDAAIARVREALAEVDPTGRVVAPDVKVGKERRDRYDLAVEHFFLQGTRFEGPAEKRLRESGVEPFTFFSEMFEEITGSKVQHFQFGSRLQRERLQESLLTSSWDVIFGDNMNKALITIASDPQDQDWRKVVKVVPLSNFLTQHRIRYGGYGNLPVVPEGADYTALTSPADEEQTYTPKKYGGTEDLTWEMMLNDEVGAIRDIPNRLAVSWRRTLKEFVFDMLTFSGMPTMGYDSVALFNAASHSNYTTAALANSALLAARLSMAQQSELTSAKRIRVIPRFLLVPTDLEVTAYQLVRPFGEGPPGSSTDDSFIKNRMGLELIVVDYWTDATDWVLMAEPSVYPVLEIGFIGGRQTPEMFTQDNASFGSMFDADKIVYKIRGAWGGTAVDHRGAHMSHQ